MARWQSANILQATGETRQVWQFSVRGTEPQLTREDTKLPTEPLPQKIISKDWQTLYQPKLNVAWLPAEKVFLRVVQLPPTENYQETISMVELQLEKLSPLPVAQIVWSFDLLPKAEGGEQTAVVVIAGRNLVEDFLGKLETAGYVADRLEVPFIDHLLATKVDVDGVWIYPGSGADKNNALVAWWYGGVLRNVSLLHLPPEEERGAVLREQIAQMSWAGELDGWLTGQPRRNLIATPEVAAVWHPMLQEGTEEPVEVVPPVPDAEVAKLTARRAAHEQVRTNLVPPEYLARYRQQFIDRIWMRSLGAVLVVYIFGVLIYLAALQVAAFKVRGLEARANGLNASYNNALRLKDQQRVLEDQLNLQFAALECYRAIAKLLPDGVTLKGLIFSRGKALNISGSAGTDGQQVVYEFNDQMRKYMVGDQPLFSKVNVPSMTASPGGLTWSFVCELKRGEGD